MLGGAGVYIADGWSNAIRAMGWEMRYWDGREPDRVFGEYQPHLYIADVRFEHKVPEAVRRGTTRVAMTVDQWARATAFATLARNGYSTTRRHVRWVRKLNPQLLYHHSSPNGIELGWSRWRTDEGRRVVSIPLAGDPTTYYDDGDDPALACDVGFVGQYSRYKSEGLHEYLLSYARSFKALIFGPGWPKGTAQATSIDDNVRNRFFKSATVMPCIHEPHARLYGVEVTERLFKVPLAHGFTISDPVACIHGEHYFESDEMLIARDGREMHELVDHFVRHPEERQPFIERARKRVLRQHTYFHRLAQMLSELGFVDRAAEVRTHVESVLDDGG